MKNNVLNISAYKYGVKCGAKNTKEKQHIEDKNLGA